MCASAFLFEITNGLKLPLERWGILLNKYLPLNLQMVTVTFCCGTYVHTNTLNYTHYKRLYEHVIGKSEILNILSCERVVIAVENWMARCSRTGGLISPQNENL